MRSLHLHGVTKFGSKSKLATQKQVLPISLQATPFDDKLLKAPGTMKGLVQQYRQKSQMLDKSQENKTKNEFFDNIAIDIFLFIAAIISMLAVIAIIHIVCRHAKLKALLTGISCWPVKQAEAVVANHTKEYCTAQWYAIAALTMMTIQLIIYIYLSNQKCNIFKRILYSNTVTIMLFFSDQIVLEKNCLLRMLMDKPSLLLHIMLRQGTSWYALDNTDFLFPPPLEESEI